MVSREGNEPSTRRLRVLPGLAKSSDFHDFAGSSCSPWQRAAGRFNPGATFVERHKRRGPSIGDRGIMATFPNPPTDDQGIAKGRKSSRTVPLPHWSCRLSRCNSPPRVRNKLSIGMYPCASAARIELSSRRMACSVAATSADSPMRRAVLQLGADPRQAREQSQSAH
jgi:hypothetical protein